MQAQRADIRLIETHLKKAKGVRGSHVICYRPNTADQVRFYKESKNFKHVGRQDFSYAIIFLLFLHRKFWHLLY